MTVAAEIPLALYDGDGVTVAFPAPWRYLTTANLLVELIASDGTVTARSLGTHYAATAGATDAGGTVTMVTAPAVGQTLRIRRVTPLAQQTAYPTSGNFPARSHELALDRLTLIAQEQAGDIDDVQARALQVPFGEVAAVLPAMAARANKFAAFDSAGALVGTPVLPGVSASGTLLATTRIVLANLSIPSAGQTAWLSEGGRFGWFEWQLGNFTALVAADTLQGIYVPSVLPGFGAAIGCWVRRWDGINAKPEWFGAIKNDGSGGVPAANYLAFIACMAICPITVLEAGDYFYNATPRVPPYRALEGVGSYRAQSGNGTRLVMMSATADVLAVGLASYPAGGINDFAKGSRVQGLSLGRDRPVTPPAIGNPEQGAAGLRMTFALHCHVEDVYADDHTIGMYFNGVVRSLVKDCKAFRQTSGTTGTGDFFRGFWADGGGAYGLSGGNGSLFLIDCNASIGGAPALTTSIGFMLTNGFVDTFLIRPEATATQFGIVLDGDSAAGSPAHIDVSINEPVLDGITGTGIEVRETNPYAAIEIKGGYIALSGAAAFAGYHIHDTQGVTVIGGQVWGVNANAAGANCFGVYVATAGRIVVQDVKAIGCKRPYGLDAVADFKVSAIVNNYGQAGSQAAVFLTNCTIGQVSAAITGQGNAFPQGIHAFGTGNVRVTIDPTGVNPACISGGATNKLQINGNAITAPGYYTSAGAGGASGAGINAIGVTA